MNTKQLMGVLKEKGITLWLEQGGLRYSAPKGAVTDDIRRALKRHKQDLIALLDANLGEGGALDTKHSDADARQRREKIETLSFAQQRLLFMAQVSGHSAAYNIPSAYQINGRLNEQYLQDSLNHVVCKHAALRTGFSTQLGDDKCFVLAAENAVFPELQKVDLTRAGNDELDRFLAAEAQRGFDIGAPPLLRATLIDLSGGEQLLAITLHHLISDGWSMQVLWKDIWQCYSARLSGAEILAVPPEYDYRDYVAWQADWAHSHSFERQKNYWVNKLRGGRELLELATDNPRPSEVDYRGDVFYFEVPAALAARLSDIGRAQNSSVYHLYLTALFALLYRYTGQDDISIGTTVANRNRREWQDMVGLFFNVVVHRQRLQAEMPVSRLLQAVRDTSLESIDYQEFPFEKIVEYLQPQRSISYSPLFQVMFMLEEQDTVQLPDAVDGRYRSLHNGISKFDLSLTVQRDRHQTTAGIEFSTALFERDTIRRLAGHYLSLLGEMIDSLDTPLNQLEMLSADEIATLTKSWNPARVDYGREKCIHELILEQAARSPNEIAIVHGEKALTYAQLGRAATSLAAALGKRGVAAGSRVGILLERSPDTVVALLGTLCAGAAYVPLDPHYPAERIETIMADAQLDLVVTSGDLEARFKPGEHPVLLVGEEGVNDAAAAVAVKPGSDHLAYVIYTSGSTGKPKGVMVSHKNVVNLFHGLDRALGEAIQMENGRPTLRALTSISFDISVLELLWTLARGYRILLEDDHLSALAGAARQAGRGEKKIPKKSLDFSLFYFASDEDQLSDKYRLLKEGARFADKNGFSAVWVPERHFHSFGGQFANPSVAAAAVAAITDTVQVRAGSVVLPLHDPIRVAEEWSMVDNLSHGRAAVAIASGWHFNDFAIQPDNFKNRHDIMRSGIRDLRRLWRGETLPRINGLGEACEVGIRPRPVSGELPIWITSAANPETFQYAGEIGANVLTHLLGQSLPELQEKIALYRRARAEHGHDPDAGKVTLMLHTFIGPDTALAQRQAEKPFKDYLRNSINLLRPVAENIGVKVESEFELVVEAGYQRYSRTGALFGTPESCLDLVAEVADIGVDEIACLIDFGVEQEAVIEHFTYLNQLKNLAQSAAPGSAQPQTVLSDHQAGLIQCTPSYARLLLAQPGAEKMLQTVNGFLVGGEALPPDLAAELEARVPGHVFNMYGPTETTVWSAVRKVSGRDCRIGGPIANTQLYVLDEYLTLMPVGAKGELYIGGEGVTHGYWRRPDLTAERFVPDPFAAPGQRLYRTGDFVRRLPDGSIEYLGRVDNQVKIRGFRIELSEIESVLREHPAVGNAVVTVGSKGRYKDLLLAYIVGADKDTTGAEVNETDVLNLAKSKLPGYMVPARVVLLPGLPLTPNGKIDIKALPDIDVACAGKKAIEPPGSGVEKSVAAIWRELLKLEVIGIHDNFFESGGHSLLLVELQRKLQQRFACQIHIIELFKYPTIASLAQRLSQETDVKQVSRRSRTTRRRPPAPAPLKHSRKTRRI